MLNKNIIKKQELFVNLNKVKLGETIKYYEGNLARDRTNSTKLSELASEALKRSTAKLSVALKIQQTKKGTGEFELFQNPKEIEVVKIDVTGAAYKTKKTIYEYFARRIKRASK